MDDGPATVGGGEIQTEKREREGREGGKGKREDGSMKCTLHHPNKRNLSGLTSGFKIKRKRQ